MKMTATMMRVATRAGPTSFGTTLGHARLSTLVVHTEPDNNG